MPAPPTVVGERHQVFRSYDCPSVNIYCAWHAISLLSGGFSMKLVTNIYHVSGNCRKASQGYRVKGQGHGSVWWWMHADRPFTVEDHLVALELIDAFHNYCRYYATKINIEDYKPITVCQTLNDCTSVRIPSCRAIINERFVKKIRHNNHDSIDFVHMMTLPVNCCYRGT